MTDKFTASEFDVSAYSDMTLDLKSEPPLYKVHGRSYGNDDGLVMLWPGNAIEFTAEFGGDLTLHYKAEENGYLQTFVDGEPNTRARLLQSDEEARVTVATVRPGRHVVRIVRDNDISGVGLVTAWKKLSFRGVKGSVRATARKTPLIEFIGDSITSGKGVMSGNLYKQDDPNHSATHAYAYLTACALNADYILTARGSCGFVRESDHCPKTAGKMYDWRNPFAKDEALIPYDFARRPDVIVLALGTNDHVEEEVFQTAAKAMIRQIRARNGEVKLVILYGMMTDSHLDALPRIAAETGAYSLRTTRDNGGGSSRETGTRHPGVEGQKRIAEELTAFLRTIL